MFRLALAALIAALLTAGWLDFKDVINAQTADICFGITAGLLAVVAAFAIRPPGEEVVEAFTGAVATLPEDVLTKLRERTIQAEELKKYIEVTSNEIFLRKLEDVLSNAIISRYKDSELERLMNELDAVERELRRADLIVSPKELPSRLRNSISEIKTTRDQSNVLDTILSELGYSRPTRSIVVALVSFVRGAVSLVLPFRL
jgi:hypothetical protein